SLSVANSTYETTALNSQKSSTDQPNSGSKSGQTLDLVNLGVAANFAILSKTGITDVYKSAITGDIGVSPAAATYITGFGLTQDSSTTYATSPQVTGLIYAADYSTPTPSRLTTAVGDMQIAYDNAAGRLNPDFLNLGAGTIGGKTLTPGLYKWTSTLNIPTDITISGSSTDVWIFQVAGNLNMSSAVRITLAGGAQAKNIFWQTAGAVTLGSTSHFEGNILSQTGINMKTAASINGRMMAQTAVTLQMNTVTIPQ
uniref:ice-binding protein n=1 Tax=Flavobacterium frigoris (strain PS1) TaxID=1086011 RepID=UPI0004437F06|nr:Chain A, ice-binding protein [Flavobacterium frigoris PS1]4NU3_B Chain B, ice-binding protein [Flavobacterium frigoris PS1]